MPHAYTQSRVFRALLVIHNPRYNSAVLVLNHARVVDALSVCFRLFSTSPNFLESGFGLLPCPPFEPWVRFSYFMVIFRLLTRNMSFVCFSYLVALTKQGQSGCLLDADARRLSLVRLL